MKSNNGYVICWYPEGSDATIIGVKIERRSRSDKDWIDEKVKVEKLLERGLKTK